MKPLRERQAWPKLCVMDMEASKWVNILCICHCDELGNRKTFYNRSDYLDWVFSDRFEGEVIFSHWGGRYDVRFIVAEAYKRKWTWDVKLSGGLMIITRIRDHKGRVVTFADSARLLPDSLEKIGESLGADAPKKDTSFDRDKLETYPLEDVTEYCMQDCDVLMAALMRMRKTLLSRGCDFAFTLASVCTRYVRRSNVLDWDRFYERSKTELDRKGKPKWVSRPEVAAADEWCFPAYFGGRTEVQIAGMFRNLFLYDITSSYPWSMLYELPAYFLGYRPPPKDLERALNVCGISDATIYLPAGTMNIPILPLRYDGKLLFAEGYFRGRWANNELLAFWERVKHNKRVVITIHSQAVYEPLCFLKPFVETFYELRQQAIAAGNEFEKYAFKIALNSVYGKLTESVTKRSIMFGDVVTETIDKYGPGSVTLTNVPGVYGFDEESEGPFRHVAAGCYITARSRIRLYEGMEHVHKLGGRVYYVDTDSIITDIPAFGLEKNKQLGRFSLEAELREAEIFCPKVYKYTKKDGEVIHKAKGMPIKGQTPEESEKRWLAFTQKYQPENQAFEGPWSHGPRSKIYKAGIRGFLTDINKGTIEPEAFELPRIMQNPDSKRNHRENGSEPLYVELTGHEFRLAREGKLR